MPGDKDEYVGLRSRQRRGGERTWTARKVEMQTMPFPIVTRRNAVSLAAAALVTPGAALAQSAERISARLTMTQRQVSLLGSVAWGSGTLVFQGRSHTFRIRGVGIGGLGVSEFTATGEVYRLERLADFGGVYGQARAGAVAGDSQLRGGMWLQNTAGVQINLHPERTGVALQLGADGMLIELD